MPSPGMFLYSTLLFFLDFFFFFLGSFKDPVVSGLIRSITSRPPCCLGVALLSSLHPLSRRHQANVLITSLFPHPVYSPRPLFLLTHLTFTFPHFLPPLPYTSLSHTILHCTKDPRLPQSTSCEFTRGSMFACIILAPQLRSTERWPSGGFGRSFITYAPS